MKSKLSSQESAQLNRILKWASLSIGICFLAILGLVYFAQRNFKGPKIGGDFTLQSIHGPVSLHDFKGKGVVLYFGYTACPDVCPLSMSHLAQALKTFPMSDQVKLQPIFISVDAIHDTPEKVQTYANYFFKGTLGVVGTKEQVDKVVDLYGTSYMIEETKKSAMGYNVLHPTSFFLVNREGEFVDSVPTEVSQETLKNALKEIL